MMSGEILWYLSRASGVVSLVLFTAVMVLGILTAGRTAAGVSARATVLRLHRSLTLVSLVFLALHIATAILDGYVDLGWLDVLVPFGSGFDPLWIGLGAVAVDLLLAVAITSALRRHLSRFAWRAVHLASYAMWPIALLHSIGTEGGDGSEIWMICVAIACTAAVLGSLAVRLLSAPSADTSARRLAAERHPNEKILTGGRR